MGKYSIKGKKNKEKDKFDYIKMKTFCLSKTLQIKITHK